MTVRSTSMPRRPFATAMTITAIVLSSVLLGTGTSYAYWSASAGTSVATTTGDVEVAVGTFSTTPLANHSLSATFPVAVTNNTVQNNAATVIGLTLAFGAAPVGFAANAKVIVWDQATAACTANNPTPLASGTWNSLTIPGLTMTKGQTKTFCVRTSLTRAVDAAASAGTNSFGARITATASVGHLSDSDTRTMTQSTSFIYPLGTTAANTTMRIFVGTGTATCFDAEDQATIAGTEIIPWACNGGANQNWRLTPSATSGYYEIYLPSAADAYNGNRVSATTTAVGGAVKLQARSGAADQDWQLQRIADGVFQLVNRQNGYCLTASSATSSNNPMTLQICSGATLQRFSPMEPALTSFSCSVSGTGNNRNLRLTWASRPGPFTLWLDGTDSGATVSGTTTGLETTINQGAYSDATRPYTVVNSGGQVVASGTFTIGTSGRGQNAIGHVLTGCTAS